MINFKFNKRADDTSGVGLVKVLIIVLILIVISSLIIYLYYWKTSTKINSCETFGGYCTYEKCDDTYMITKSGIILCKDNTNKEILGQYCCRRIKNEEQSFSLHVGESKTFVINGVTHSISIDEMTDNYVKITIQTEPKQYTIPLINKKGELETDINDDSVTDIKVVVIKNNDETISIVIIPKYDYPNDVNELSNNRNNPSNSRSSDKARATIAIKVNNKDIGYSQSLNAIIGQTLNIEFYINSDKKRRCVGYIYDVVNKRWLNQEGNLVGTENLECTNTKLIFTYTPKYEEINKELSLQSIVYKEDCQKGNACTIDPNYWAASISIPIFFVDTYPTPRIEIFKKSSGEYEIKLICEAKSPDYACNTQKWYYIITNDTIDCPPITKDNRGKYTATSELTITRPANDENNNICLYVENVLGQGKTERKRIAAT
ncbi:MAG: hypothetical protein QXG00_00280 [Candidatus Woesearchaeota archaeon]